MRWIASSALMTLIACAGTPQRAWPDPVLRDAEGHRVESDARLIAALDAASANPSTGVDAVIVMARIQSKKYLSHLVRAAAPEHPVREEALWAIGQLAFGYDWRPGDGAAALPSVEGGLSDRDAHVVAEAAVAWGKIGGDPARLALLLPHPVADVRVAAARGIFWASYLYSVRAPAAREALVAALRDVEPVVRWNAAYVLQTYADEATRDALEKAAADPDVWTRLFAVRGLGKIKAPVPAAAAHDPHYFVRVEAAKAMGKDAPRELARDPSHHVRMAYARATADPEMLKDASADVRGEAIVALAKSGKREAAEKGLADPDWRIRAKAVEAIGSLPEVRGALSDSDRRVVQAAVTALGSIKEGEALDLLCRLATHGDVGIEWCAAEALGHRGDRRGAEALAARARRRESIVLEQVVNSLEQLKSADALEAVAQSGRYPYVAMARRAIWRLNSREAGSSVEERPGGFRFDAPLFGRWRLELRHGKGKVVMMLDGDAAPEHVTSVVTLAQKGYYSGLEWHRVVSNFVIQGGDPRGDGYGDPGYRILDEISPALSHTRGAVGMSKMAKDTGDSQLYITHVPTPHLDGRYTVFGYVVEGMDVVDRIETGDKILQATVVESK